MIGLGLAMKDDGFLRVTRLSPLLGVSFVGPFLIMGAGWLHFVWHGWYDTNVEWRW